MRAFVFDLDGTLLNTLADIASACDKMLGLHGYPQHPLAAYAHMVGNGFATLVKRALPVDSLPSPHIVDDMVMEAKSIYANNMMDQTKPYDGMVKALKYLQNQGAALAVLSNKPDDLTVELISHYFPDIPFKHVQGGRPDIPLKPDPQALLQIMENMDAQKTETCYVGDSNVDIYTAKNADISAIGAEWGFRGQDELKEAGADIILSNPMQLCDLLEFKHSA